MAPRDLDSVPVGFTSGLRGKPRLLSGLIPAPPHGKLRPWLGTFPGNQKGDRSPLLPAAGFGDESLNEIYFK